MYRCGGHLGWSSLFYFRALKPGVDGYRFAVYGDMGNVNPQSLSRLQDEAQRGHFDMILHNGKARTFLSLCDRTSKCQRNSPNDSVLNHFITQVTWLTT